MYKQYKIAFGALLALSGLSVGLAIASCVLQRETKIESTRFGVIESLPLNSGSTELFIIKDQRTKKQYLLCANCTITEYKEKKQ
jgi:hypothetical protein